MYDGMWAVEWWHYWLHAQLRDSNIFGTNRGIHNLMPRNTLSPHQYKLNNFISIDVPHWRIIKLFLSLPLYLPLFWSTWRDIKHDLSVMVIYLLLILEYLVIIKMLKHHVRTRYSSLYCFLQVKNIVSIE